MCVDIMFGLDVVFTFRTAYQDGPDVLVWSPKLIAFKYLKGWFLIDLVSTVPIDVIVVWYLSFQQGESTVEKDEVRSIKLIRTVRLFRLLKLMRLLRMSRLFRTLVKVLDINPALLMIMQFAAKLYVCA